METAHIEQQIADAAATIGLTGDDEQYLTFMLNGEEYGVDILRIREIKGWDRVTHIPNSPDYMRGVINLRGAIVPVIDLRQRFAMPSLEYTPTTVVIVLSVKGGERDRIMGIVVDAVSDVYNIPESEFRPAPTRANDPVLEAVSSLATVDEKMVILLDIDRLFSTGELASLEDANK